MAPRGSAPHSAHRFEDEFEFEEEDESRARRLKAGLQNADLRAAELQSCRAAELQSL